ncbi:SAM-dependent DNA methyltransferase [Campylobacter upsaliensis]|uniref:type I restriction-modification system subunit M n=1 Tax=Campylobacter upsaliensis TaxID=28080 RepID=UPI001272317C|nr:class I SAM-dependent DNA methyltransferase [Campylobacter upsaliensis]EAI5601927.1 SAM-dependent DNA methyltransferase [Campylobacter upsaliensis]EAJ7130928.1 SAM-dependent DNA methyltransferase [Campylobacter upsaliensis]EAK6956359.1 SAM-dependent DNA methyltransferase [Campylobacter upsaliensis]EAL3930138.1 SAM-dependent DNA methyltransferase [Campylobacter upsaliensis]EAL4024904.1 SAM-dependent DNA methyltransferase [Campylobacter upsaliensis]
MQIHQFQPIISFIWSVADDLLRDVYVKGKYRDVILPMTILRRLDVILEPTKDKVLETYNEDKDIADEDTLKDLLCDASKSTFYNYSNFTLKKLLNDPKNIRINFENYLDGFSGNIKDIISKFKFRNQLDTLDEAKILYGVIERFCSPKINLSMHDIKNDKGEILHKGLSNLGMGYVFEELIRKFNEENNEEAGEHFTPRELIDLMTHLVFLPVKDKIQKGAFSIYDNACGSGGMLTESKEFIIDESGPIRSKAQIYLYGQETNDKTYAICKADMLIKGENPDNIKYGSTLSEDKLSGEKFDFMLTNPPYGKNWEEDQKELNVSKKGGIATCNDPRFQVGITSKSDGQMMFLLNMLSKMKKPKENNGVGSRIASVHNGSSLFNSDSGMVAIRKYIIENDLLEAIIALPTNMFYNTGIPTFIWILTNNKTESKKDKVQLINATKETYYTKMKKSLGQKQNNMTKEHIDKITNLFLANKENDDCKIYDNAEFGYAKITIERPKSIEFLVNDEKFQALQDKDKILAKLQELDSNPQDFTSKEDFINFLDVKLKKAEENLLIDSDKTNNTEKIPLTQDIQSYYETEVKPYVPNSWIAWESKAIGYEILFNKYFYTYTPPRSLEAIDKDLQDLEQETQDLLKQILC